jgi:hypothetical protein
MVRDALKRLVWPKLTWWDCEDKDLRTRLENRKLHFRGLSIAQVADPVAWALVCSVWNSRRMDSVRAAFDVSVMASKGTNHALEVLASALVLQMSSNASPLARLKRFLELVGVERTPAQEVAHARAQVRGAATQSAADALRASACYVDGNIVLDASLLLGSLLTQKAEFVRFRHGKAMATVQRIRLDGAAEILASKANVTAALAPMGNKPGRWSLSVRWTNASGTVGGLDFSSVDLDTIRDDLCTLIEFPESLPECAKNKANVSACPIWATTTYIEAATKRQEAERKAKESAEIEARFQALRAQWSRKAA